MSKLTDFSMKNIAAVIILVLLLTIGGSYAGSSLKVESMPDISFPVVLVTTTYKAPPTDVMEDVTKPLEKALAGMEGVKSLTSSSHDNYSQIIIELDQGKKPEDSKRDVEELIGTVRLPQTAEKPKAFTFGFASQPVYYLSVYGKEGMNQAELDRVVKDVIVPGFTSLPGFDHMDVVGDREATLDIKLDANAINNYGLTPAQVYGLISSALVSSPAGAVDFNGNTQMVRVKGELDSIYNLENLKITTFSGDTLLLKQIAKVEAISEAQFITRLNGEPAVAIHLYKTKEGNIVEFASEIDKLIEQWKQSQPDIVFETIIDGAVEIKKSISGMLREGALGAVLASLMILLFLKNIRMTAIVLVSIPLSLLVTLLFMAMLDISLNIMTLGGMAIAIGRVVDDSIVVIENIYSHLKKVHERNESVIKYATKQVSAAITSSTITTVGVFAPITFVSGVVGEVFRPFAITLVSALLASLLVALTVIPMLAKLLVMRSKSIRYEEPKEGRLLQMYRRILTWGLNNRGKSLLIALLIFIFSWVTTIPFLATSFMPASDGERTVFFQLKLPNETSLETMDAQTKIIEQMMREAKDSAGQPLFNFAESLIGYDFSNDQHPNAAMILSEVSKNALAGEVVKEFKEKFAEELPLGSEVFGQTLSFGPPESGTAFTYSLKGEDALQLRQGAALIKEKLKDFPELTNVKDSLDDTKTEVEVTVDQNKARLYGLSTGQVTQMMNSWISKQPLGDLKFDNVTFKTTVELDPIFKDNVQKLGALQLRTPMGSQIRLDEIAKVRQIDSPSAIHREGQKQYVTVSAKIDSADIGGVSAKVSAALKDIELPSGVSSEVKGASEDIEESFKEMFIAMIASVFIVYLIMVIAFGNASAPLAIIFSLPLAVIGGLYGLLITRSALDITALIGFLMLIGIVVTNAIVLIDRVQQLREAGTPTREALMEAGVNRMRPIIMTAGATIFALLPLALGMSEGTIISKGLAVVVIGGLITSTLLTLVVVPVAYELIDKIKVRLARLIGWDIEPGSASASEQTHI